MNKNTHTFDDWFTEVKNQVKIGRPIYLIGGPDPDAPEEFYPQTDEYVSNWVEENEVYFKKYYEDGECPNSALVEFVM
jgi:hypothetical protein